MPEHNTPEPGPSRTTVLEELQHFLGGVLGTSPRILQAAGAIPIRVNQDQLRQIIRNPLVKAVRTNRRLK